MRAITRITIIISSAAVLAGCPRKSEPVAVGPAGMENVATPAPTPTFSAGVVQVDELAPDFELKDTEGNTITKADFTGQILILDFWATWCDSCVKKLKEYEPIIAKYADKGVELVAVSLDSSPQVAAGWAKQTNSPYKIAMFNDEFKAAYFPEVQGQVPIPQVRIIDRDGNLRFKFDAQSVAQDLDLALAQLVEEKVGGGEGEGEDAHR